MIYLITLLILILGCCLYETFKEYDPMWSYCVVRYPVRKIEKIKFERQFRDLKWIVEARERSVKFDKQWRENETLRSDKKN